VIDTKKSKKKGRKRRNREEDVIVRDLILALNLCHNVTPVTNDTKPDRPRKELQASSPDEVALVTFGEEMGIELVKTEPGKSMVLKYPNGVLDEFEILMNFPFSSDTKRMGMIVKHLATGKLMFYVKGADTVMVDKVKPAQRSNCKEHCEYLAMEGLRTLVITQRMIS